MQSNDIDVALENMMGLPFAELLQKYCGTVKGIPVAKIAKVERNPDRSKHLETAKSTVLGIELDFVNLRSEEYTENSRIPSQIVRMPYRTRCLHTHLPYSRSAHLWKMP